MPLLYSGWMVEAGIEARGIAPLKADLDRISAVTDKAGLLALMAKVDISAPFSLDSRPIRMIRPNTPSGSVSPVSACPIVTTIS